MILKLYNPPKILPNKRNIDTTKPKQELSSHYKYKTKETSDVENPFVKKFTKSELSIIHNENLEVRNYRATSVRETSVASSKILRFFSALTWHDTYKVEQMLTENPELANEHNHLKERESSLSYAARLSSSEIIALLINAGAKNVQETICNFAVKGQTSCVKNMLKAGVDPNSRDDNGNTLLDLATIYNHFELEQFLVTKRGRRLNTKLSSELVRNHKEGTILASFAPFCDKSVNENKLLDTVNKAAKNGDVQTIVEIIQQGFNINKPYINGFTLLTRAVKNNEMTTVKTLLQAGANVNARNCNHKRSLLYAIVNDNVNITAFLLNNGAKIRSNELYPAANLGNQKILNLIKAKLDTNVAHYQKYLIRAAYYAATQGEVETILSLKRLGVDINQTDKQGYSSLTNAVKDKKVITVETLIKAGVDVNAKDRNGNIALVYAAASGMDEIVILLVQNGAINDPNITYTIAMQCATNTKLIILKESFNRNEASNLIARKLLFIALAKCEFELVKQYIQEGADINIVDTRGNTLLMDFVVLKSMPAITFLLKLDIKINLKNSLQLSAVSLAIRDGYTEAVICLLHFKATITFHDINKALYLNVVEVTELLCNYNNIDYKSKNNCDDNALSYYLKYETIDALKLLTPLTDYCTDLAFDINALLIFIKRQSSHTFDDLNNKNFIQQMIKSILMHSVFKVRKSNNLKQTITTKDVKLVQHFIVLIKLLITKKLYDANIHKLFIFVIAILFNYESAFKIHHDFYKNFPNELQLFASIQIVKSCALNFKNKKASLFEVFKKVTHTPLPTPLKELITDENYYETI